MLSLADDSSQSDLTSVEPSRAVEASFEAERASTSPVEGNRGSEWILCAPMSKASWFEWCLRFNKVLSPCFQVEAAVMTWKLGRL